MKYFLVCFLLLSSLFYSQQITLPPGMQLKSSPYSSTVIDTSELNVFYQYETERKSNTPYVAILQLGKKHSKFCDYTVLKSDSLMQLYSKKNTVNAEEMNLLLNIKVQSDLQVFKNYQEQNVYYQNRVYHNKYEYSETQPTINWTLSEDSKIILGYSCKRATTHYRGRDYIAWYTTAIPQSQGPVYFGGLPGLIMEITEETGKIKLVAVGVNKTPMTMYKRNESSYLQVSREKFRKIQKAYIENPEAFMTTKAYNTDGTELKINKPSKKIDYNPLELE